MIKLLFTRSNSIGSYFIRRVTWSEYSHVEFVTTEGELIGASFPHGVIRTPMHVRMHKCSSHRYIVIEGADYSKALQFLNDQMGKPYDVSAIFGMLYRRDWEEADKWFCSELQAAASKAGGAELVKKPGWRITPQDLLQSPLGIG